ncbi:frigida-like protein, partial [Trifolium medium]|nr:frigida-like protein [Trifolium medium]
ELESKDEKLKVHVKEPKSKENWLEFDGHVKDLESKPNKFDGQLQRPCSREKQYDALIELFDEEAELGK